MQLEDIMKFQKMELISAGTDFDVIRYAALLSQAPSNGLVLCIGKRLLLATSTRPRESRVLASSLISEQVCPPIFIRQVHFTGLGVSSCNYFCLFAS